MEIEEAVADKGYYSTDTLELGRLASIRTYIPEPKRKGNGKRNWESVPEEKRRAVLNNRRRTQGVREASDCNWRVKGWTEFRSYLWNGRCAAKLVVQLRRFRTLPDCSRGTQPGPGHVQAVQHGHCERPTGRGRPCLCCVACLVSHQSPLTSRKRVWVASCLRHRLLGDGRLTPRPRSKFTPISTGCQDRTKNKFRVSAADVRHAASQQTFPSLTVERRLVSAREGLLQLAQPPKA